MIETSGRYQPTDDRKRAIAAAARSLIVEKGFEGLRTREIAERVGINIATLHYHVPSKEALIELVAQSMKDDFISQHMRMPREGLSPLAQLQAQFEEIRATRDSNPELLQVTEELSRRARHDPNVARFIQPLMARWHEQFAEILKTGIADGIFRSDLDAEAGAAIIVGAVVATNSSLKPGHQALDAVAAELLRSLLSVELKGKADV